MVNKIEIAALTRILKDSREYFWKINKNVIGDKLMREVFRNYPSQKLIMDVVMKVIIISETYKAIVYSYLKMAQHITKIKGLKYMISKGDLEAVDLIRFGHGIKRKKTGEEIDFYSFATKYCHWSNPRYYPIYDQYVGIAIKRTMNIPQKNLKDYKNFKNIIDEKLLNVFGGTSYKKLDEALWIFGKFLKNQLPLEIQQAFSEKIKKLGFEFKE